MNDLQDATSLIERVQRLEREMAYARETLAMQMLINASLRRMIGAMYALLDMDSSEPEVICKETTNHE